jgi:hypothetical protein
MESAKANERAIMYESTIEAERAESCESAKKIERAKLAEGTLRR